MSRLNKPAARVTVWEPKPEAFFADPGATNGIGIYSLRVTFTVTRTEDKDPDTCEITITNANADSRALFQRKPLSIRLEAGYDGDLRTLFIGDLTYAQSRYEGTEWVTTLQVGDGMRAYRNARVSQTFREGVTALEALKVVAKSLQFALPNVLLSDPSLQSQFASGLTLQGAAQEQMTRLLEPLGYRWTIQSGRLVVLKSTEVLSNDAIVVDSFSGLIGSPEAGTPEKDGKAPITTIECLLNYDINPGRLLLLTSRQHRDAKFKVLKVTNVGDTHGGEFKTTVEAKPI